MISPRLAKVDLDHSPPRLVFDVAGCSGARKGTVSARDLVAKETTILLTGCPLPHVRHNLDHL